MEFDNPISDLCDNAGKLFCAKTEDMRLEFVKVLSRCSARLVAAMVLVMTDFLFAIVLTFAFVLLIGHLTGNYFYGALIALGVIAIVGFILFLNRRKLFRRTYTRFFLNLFEFDESIKDVDTARMNLKIQMMESKNAIDNDIERLCEIREYANMAISALKGLFNGKKKQ